ncbi:Glu/Leu/Phe/Val dehydrogenase [candidate division KSB1 bacterium]|nr:MAG: Glu/Leu/Phe/Val dehydrogenase [candidate division KSB1 bacterium]MBC6950994.1 Glu/Leu/Phe/Val dehydrogenase [candidate division KSB1 bacterium]MCE7945630.1 Glu/Leu/Phe/Val dehydrogenase [Chlorobi bacterium CHB1]MDL1876500.1 Glu/Leu/Phe/Val dehydrogenase [Cytophagia bacterium CHB2]
MRFEHENLATKVMDKKHEASRVPEKENIIRDRLPMMVVEYHDERSGANAYLVIDMLVNGVAGGGCRMKKGVTPEEMIKLAQTMTRKFTLTEPPIGGAKLGIDYDPARPDKLAVMQRVFEFLQAFLYNCYVTGADLNTNETEIITCTNAIGLPCPQYALAKRLGNAERRMQRFYEGINLKLDERGAMVMNAAATGYGICTAALRAVSEHNLKGCSVALQGFGNVGGGLAKFLWDRGAKIQALSDRFGAIYCKQGLDIDFLLARRNERAKAIFPELLAATDRPAGYELIADPEIIYELGDDLFIPVADSGVITEKNYKRIKAKYVVCGSNDPFAPASIEELLFESGKVVVPDFIANAGTAALYHTLICEEGPVTASGLLASVDRQIGAATDEALAKARAEKISPRRAAEIIAAEKINAYPAHYPTTISKRWV